MYSRILRQAGSREKGSSGKQLLPVVFTHPAFFTQRIDGIATSFPRRSQSQRPSGSHCHSARITTSFPRRRESSPSADRAIKVSPPGIVLLHPSCLPGSFPFLGTNCFAMHGLHDYFSWIPAFCGNECAWEQARSERCAVRSKANTFRPYVATSLLIQGEVQTGTRAKARGLPEVCETPIQRVSSCSETRFRKPVTLGVQRKPMRRPYRYRCDAK